MKNSYVGDIGDFGKYGLLRHLCCVTGKETDGDPLRLGVVWYLNEGKGTDYLTDESKGAELKACDPELYQKLQWLVGVENRRNIAAVRDSLILPCDTLYYDEPIPNGSRRQWFKRALDAIREAKLVFVDPDTGIVPKNRAKDDAIGPQYVSVGELRCLYKKGKSLIVYQHGDHTENQIKEVSQRLKPELCLPKLPWGLAWHRDVGRAFLVVPQEKHKLFLSKRLEAIEGSEWRKKRPKWPKWKRPHFTIHRY